MRYQVGNRLWCNVFDDCEGWEDEDCGWFRALEVVDVGGVNGHIRCGEHESLSGPYQYWLLRCQ